MAEESDDKRGYDYDDENEGHYGQEYEDENDEDSDISINDMAVLGTYHGQRNSRNERHGYGKTLLPNGDAYVGTYKNGVRHGLGHYKFKSGAMYRGCYKGGLRNGKGVMHYPDSSKYDGYWTDNKKDGEGVFTYANHDQFSGSWKSDMKHGLGTYIFCKTGATVKGSWLEDKRVNNFHVYFPTCSNSGFTFQGTWDDYEVVDGDGYFVFERLNCMQSGIHVENPSYVKNETAKENNINETIWYSDKILPIMRGMLPRLPKNRPMAARRSSCKFDSPVATPTSHVSSESANCVETYEHKDDFWAEGDECVAPEFEQAEIDSKSSDYQQQDEDIETAQ